MENLHHRVEAFRSLVERNHKVLELVADAGEKLGGEYIFDSQYLKSLTDRLQQEVRGVVYDLEMLTEKAFPDLARSFLAIQSELQNVLTNRISIPETDFIIPLDQVNGEMADAVGQKMARLGEIGNRLGFRIPHGFVATTWACKTYFEASGLQPVLDDWSKYEENDEAAGIEKSERVRSAILEAPVPGGIQKAIHAGLKKLRKKTSCERLAVRSSASGEDGKLSFAGLYTTKLGVRLEDSILAFQQVVASLFSPSAVTYGMEVGTHPARAVMAVGFQALIEARAAGVLYTLNPNAPEDDAMIISAVPGLAKPVVDGTSNADQIVLSRKPPHRFLSVSAAEKREMWAAIPGSGVGMRETPENLRLEPCLNQAEAVELARVALQIEQYMRCAQDIEWALDQQGKLWILQARPLRLAPNRVSRSRPIGGLGSTYRILMRDGGTVACGGIGAGPVVIAGEDYDPMSAPQGAILVARATSPRLSVAVQRAGAVVTDLGSATGHLATIAREFRVPMIVGTREATRIFRNILEATVNADDNIIYDGIVPELVHEQLLAYSEAKESKEFLTLRRILKKVAPLTLNDPQSSNFKASNCRSFHDIIRFAHEQAVQCLTEQSCLDTSRAAGSIRRLDLAIPLDLVMLDMGGGLKSVEGHIDTARIEDVACAPLRPLVEGLLTPGVWSRDPVAMDLDGFMASATRSELTTAAVAPAPQQNLAVISDSYLHLNLKLGYHFNIIDCYLSSNINDNFIYFRFAGGVTEMMRRTRRARLLTSILERLDFITERKGDLVIGRAKKLAWAEMETRLRTLGKLIGYTRQLDVSLRDDFSVDACVNQFMAEVCGPGQK